MLSSIVVILFCIARVQSFLLVHGNTQRDVIKILRVPNGGPWGQWTTKEFCAAGAYAVGYNLKIEGPQGSGGDDTTLNAITLRCATIEGQFGGTVHSGEGPWGNWIAEDTKHCDNRQGVPHFMTGFSMFVEPGQADTRIRTCTIGRHRLALQSNNAFDHSAIATIPKKGSSGDDTEANFVKFLCRDFAATTAEYELVLSPGYGLWGSWGRFSQSCGPNSAICGLTTRIESPQGSGDDDTALNDIIMYCCA